MTYSIIAREPATGDLGIAVQSRFFAAGRVVPWIESGVGVVASQAFPNPKHGHEALQRLRSGADARSTLEKLVNEDPGEAARQLAILDAHGRMAVHTGAKCVAAAGHEIGVNCCAQANMMGRDTVWKAMVEAFDRANGEMADRLLEAMDAAEHEGGDIRGKQAASLIVVSGRPSGIPRLDHSVDLRVDDHPDPVGEIRRLLRYSRAHGRARQALGKVSAKDPIGALSDLDDCCAAFPDEQEFRVRRAMILLSLGRLDAARSDLARAYAVHPGSLEVLLRYADAGVVPIGRQVLEPFIATVTAGRQRAPT
jgi:uncharacterized Ntn-hydrolase superfamily protein